MGKSYCTAMYKYKGLLAIQVGTRCSLYNTVLGGLADLKRYNGEVPFGNSSTADCADANNYLQSQKSSSFMSSIESVNHS